MRRPTGWSPRADGGATSTRPRKRSRGNQHGSATLELVVLFPVVLAIIFGAVQAALYFHARSVALAAAQEGARAAAAQHGTAANGASTAWSFLNQAGGQDVLTNAHVTPDRTASQATITVTGQSLTVLPGLPGLPVQQTARRPVERFTADDSPPTNGAP